MECKLCNINKTKLYYKGFFEGYGNYEYYLCNNCNTIFLKDKLNNLFLEEFYSTENYHSNDNYKHNYFKNRNNVYENKFKKIFLGKNKNIKILDYGCGDGSFIKFMINKGFKNIKGYEYEISVRDKLKNKGIDILKDLENNEKFDIITVFDVIEHVDNPKNLFNNLGNKLSKDGTIIYTTGIYNKYIDILDKGYCSWINFPQHLWVFSYCSFKYMNKKLNLTLIYKGYNGVHFASNSRIILGYIKNIIFNILNIINKNRFNNIGFPGINGVYIYKKNK